MPPQSFSTAADPLAEHEALVAERYRGWAIYLLREQRRLRALPGVAGTAGVAAQLPATAAPLPPDEDAELPDELAGRAALLAGSEDF